MFCREIKTTHWAEKLVWFSTKIEVITSLLLDNKTGQQKQSWDVLGCKVFFNVCNLTLQPSCYWTGLGSLFCFVLYLLSIPRLQPPASTQCFGHLIRFFCSLSCSSQTEEPLMDNHTSVSLEDSSIPKINCLGRMWLVPRLWFPGHTMISPSPCCLTHSKIWVDKRSLFLFCTQCTEVCKCFK